MPPRFVVIPDVQASAQETLRALLQSSTAVLPSVNIADALTLLLAQLPISNESTNWTMGAGEWASLDLPEDLKQRLLDGLDLPLNVSGNAAEFSSVMHSTFAPSFFACACFTASLLVCSSRELYIRRVMTHLVKRYGLHTLRHPSPFSSPPYNNHNENNNNSSPSAN